MILHLKISHPVSRFVSLFRYEKHPTMSGTRTDMWTSMHCFLARGKGVSYLKHHLFIIHNCLNQTFVNCKYVHLAPLKSCIRRLCFSREGWWERSTSKYEKTYWKISGNFKVHFVRGLFHENIWYDDRAVH